MKMTAICNCETETGAWDEAERKLVERTSVGVSAEAAPLGLCATCNHLPGCAFRRKPGSPVLFCEEFDGTEGGAEDPGTGHSMKPRMWEEREPLLGLCGNCDNRLHCALRAPEGGVWHCEEYA